MTNHKRSSGNGVAGPLLASLSALVLLAGVGWFVVRQTGEPRPTGQEEAVTSVAPVNDRGVSASTPTPTPAPTRAATAPSRGSTRTATPTASTRTPSKTPSKTPTRTTASKSTYSPESRHTATPTKSPKPTKPPKPSGGSGTVQQQVLTLTNQERAKSGCGPLRFNTALTKAAQAHATDMVVKHFFAHDSLDGRSPFDRMKAAGFTGGAMAENIAVGYSSAAAVVEGWMNSPGHRVNILNCTYTMIGIGYNAGQVKPDLSNGSWVQDFGG